MAAPSTCRSAGPIWRGPSPASPRPCRSDQRAHLGIIAGDEGEAGAVNLYGAAYGLPRAISGMNSNWLRGYGDPPPHTLIAIGMDRDFLLQNFTLMPLGHATRKSLRHDQ